MSRKTKTRRRRRGEQQKRLERLTAAADISGGGGAAAGRVNNNSPSEGKQFVATMIVMLLLVILKNYGYGRLQGGCSIACFGFSCQAVLNSTDKKGQEWRTSPVQTERFLAHLCSTHNPPNKIKNNGSPHYRERKQAPQLF